MFLYILVLVVSMLVVTGKPNFDSIKSLFEFGKDKEDNVKLELPHKTLPFMLSDNNFTEFINLLENCSFIKIDLQCVRLKIEQIKKICDFLLTNDTIKELLFFHYSQFDNGYTMPTHYFGQEKIDKIMSGKDIFFKCHDFTYNVRYEP